MTNNNIRPQHSPPGCQRLSRRNFLRAGATGSVILATAGSALSLSGCTPAVKSQRWQWLADSDIPFIHALLRAIIAEALPATEPERSDALQAATRQLDNHIAAMSAEMHKVLRQLLDVATLPLTRGLATGVWQDWDQLSIAETNAFLTRWQHSSLFLFRMAHGSLVQLLSMTWYGLPESFSWSGYPGVLHPQILVTEANNY